MHILRHIYSSSVQTFKDLYLTDDILNQINNSTVKNAKHSTSVKPLPVLACQLFKINYLRTSKNTPFQDSRSNIDSSVRYYNYCDEHWQEKFCYLKLTKFRKIDAF